MKNVLIRVINKISLWCGYQSAVCCKGLLMQCARCSERLLFSWRSVFSLCLCTACSTSMFWCSRGMYCLLVQGDWILQMEAVCSSVTLVGTRTTWPVDPRNSLHFNVDFVSPLVWILVAKGAVRLLIGWSNQMCTDQHGEIYMYCEILWWRETERERECVCVCVCVWGGGLLTLWSPSPNEAWVQLLPTYSCMYYNIHKLNLGLGCLGAFTE